MKVITILPAIFMAAYGFYCMMREKGLKYWWHILLYALATIGLGIVLDIIFGAELSSVIILTANILLMFFFLHVRNHRMSLLFHILFDITIILIAAISLIYRETLIFNTYIMVLIYMLTEINQAYMRYTYEESSNNYQNMILTKQVNEVQNIYMTMRGWRHDYHNHLQTLKAHLKMGQTVEAYTYLDKLEVDLDSVNKLIETGNVNLDAILNSKLSLALTREIDINYKASVPEALTVTNIDLCVLIGNLIDNAMEACEKITGGKKFIRLYIGVLKKQLYISVTNSTSELVRKLDNEYITTKRGNHGHGLKRINNIVEKYQGFIRRNNEPGVFITEIMLPL